MLEVFISASFRDLRVWQDAMKLASELYRMTAGFPKHELYGLSQQMRRAAVSVPSNIAEGKGHRSDKGFANFLFHARGSLLELETQIEIARDLEYLTQVQASCLLERTRKVGSGLTGLINALSKTENSRPMTVGLADDRRPTTDD
jgi:four helix bundle protein